MNQKNLSKNIFIAFALCLSMTLFPAFVIGQDSIDKAASDTDRILKEYERTKDPKEIRSWIVAYHGEAPSHQVMLSFAEWSFSHQDDFVLIVEGLEPKEQEKFVGRFAWALSDIQSEEKFKEKFKAQRSKVVSMVLAKIQE